jgi:putative ABC transport system permease protein
LCPGSEMNGMLKVYFTLAWRNLTKNFRFSVLNLIGLSTGLACAILIYLWVSNELHVNKFSKNDARIYQVMHPSTNGDQASENTPGLLASALVREMPEVEYAAAVIPSSWFSNKGLFSFDESHIRADGQFVSKDYFHIFPCHFVEGNSDRLFASKSNIVISRDLAEKLFGSTQGAIGKTIEWNQENFNEHYEIAGIFDKFPSNSTIRFDAVLNYDQILDKRSQLQAWDNNDPNTYLLLKSGVNVDQFNGKLRDFVKTKKPESAETLFAQRFSDTYLYNHYENGKPSGGRISYIKLFSIIALFILLIACINFMNLTTAQAFKRMKDVGVQKVVGATRRSLIIQYLCESMLMAFLSLISAILFVALLLPLFKEFTGKDLAVDITPTLILSITAIAAFTGLVSGSYPALYLSGFRPALILKGNLKNSVSEVVVRKGLVVFQFTVSVVLIVSVIIIYQQMQLIETTNLGYNRDHVIYFDKGGNLSENKNDYKPGAEYKDLVTFIAQIKTIPGVVNASNFRHSIVDRDGGTTDISWPGKSTSDQTAFTDIACGYNFIETLNIPIKEGRAYSRAFGSDSDKVVFNEAAIKAMGLRDPIGKTVRIWGADKQIIGVTKDFHFQSLYKNIRPCFFDLNMNQRVSKLIVRIKPGDEKATIRQIAGLYKSFTGEALDYKFLDEDYQSLYVSEERVAALSKGFALIAIIISCLGLFGLTAFTAQKKRKEIGIRKVMGASINDIMILLSEDFLMLISLSILIAFPVSWWLMNSWLGNFAYRIPITPFVFVVAAIAVLAITLVTISIQFVRSARTNPVINLRSE